MLRTRACHPKSTSAGVVEMTTALRTFFTSTNGAPDLLFGILLDSAREARAVTSALSQREPSDPRVVGLAAETYLCGLLLRDASFVPARVAPDWGHHYSLNLVTGEVRLTTEAYAPTAGGGVLFGITLRGTVGGKQFEILNTSTQAFLARVSEDEIKKPNFFRDELPSLTRPRVSGHELGSPDATSIDVDSDIELELSFSLADAPYTYVIRKKRSAGYADVYEIQTGQVVGRIALGCLQKILQKKQAKNNGASSPGACHLATCFLHILGAIARNRMTSDSPGVSGDSRRCDLTARERTCGRGI
jgi:hypothetical protein